MAVVAHIFLPDVRQLLPSSRGKAPRLSLRCTTRRRGGGLTSSHWSGSHYRPEGALVDNFRGAWFNELSLVGSVSLVRGGPPVSKVGFMADPVVPCSSVGVTGVLRHDE